MSKSAKLPRRGKKGLFVNISPQVHRMIYEHKEATGITVQRIVEDALKAALAK